MPPFVRKFIDMKIKRRFISRKEADLIIKNGFSRPAFISRDANYNSLMTYEGVSFIEYLYYAETYASIHELNIFSK